MLRDQLVMVAKWLRLCFRGVFGLELYSQGEIGVEVGGSWIGLGDGIADVDMMFMKRTRRNRWDSEGGRKKRR